VSISATTSTAGSPENNAGTSAIAPTPVTIALTGSVCARSPRRTKPALAAM
jgi:hypothetical protein